MDEWLGRLLIVTYPTVIACGTALAMYWLKLRSDRQIAARNNAAQEQLAEQIELLRHEHAAEIAELQERLDFTERAITSAPTGRLEAPRKPTPV